MHENRLRVLHTSDWHLGRALYLQDRTEEFDAWLNWLKATIEEEHIDVLLIAGDIFDTSNAPTAAQKQYYQFVAGLKDTCRVIITSGNHDSARLIDAPHDLMEALDITVIGQPRDEASDEVFLIKDRSGTPALIVCAVPFLRDSYLTDLANETPTDDKSTSPLQRGMSMHYKAVYAQAEAIRRECGMDLPVIAMGHLTAAGCAYGGDDGVRDLYVGTLEGITPDVFDGFDYVALGHIHKPMPVGNQDHIRYSGSPIPMGFGEINQTKSVCIVEFDGRKPCISLKPIPRFQELQSISGDLKEIKKTLKSLIKLDRSIWFQVEYTGDEIIPNLNDIVYSAIENTKLVCIRVQNRVYVQNILKKSEIVTSDLSELNPNYIFEDFLKNNESSICEEDAQQLIDLFKTVLVSVQNLQSNENNSDD